MQQQKFREALEVFLNNITLLENQPYKDLLATAHFNLGRCYLRLENYIDAQLSLEKNLNIVEKLDLRERFFRSKQELAFSYFLLNKIEKTYSYLSEITPMLSAQKSPDKAHFFFYLSLYCKKSNLNDSCDFFLNLSKKFFLGRTQRNFIFLKKHFYNNIESDISNSSDKDRDILKRVVDELMENTNLYLQDCQLMSKI